MITFDELMKKRKDDASSVLCIMKIVSQTWVINKRQNILKIVSIAVRNENVPNIFVLHLFLNNLV